ncbi:DUF6602 domain-containing protein [Leptolyngbya sp. PCC 6406]|uniref:DUF6602 domain-containing protein n=1 Tax=Leptolyngbya sp. PCC 6406 TaxID=1173264 RepID=UPI0002ABDFC5|nr:DUF6602 domain-containing protein [Leptolyngbya sp. PCC 6406]
MSGYNGYVHKLSRRVLARLTGIEALYNFDLGDEFEVAMCHVLSEILPAKFGVCRGFVVSEDGSIAGDDIVIFDRLLCPTLRSNEGISYASKDQIPVEAVYAYIECKHSIRSDDTFQKAVEQVRTVKSLVLARTPLRNPNYAKEGPIYNGQVQDWPRVWPRLRNQPFGVILSREWNGCELSEVVSDDHTPDLVILGADSVMTQYARLGPDGIKGSLFHDPRHFAKLQTEQVKGKAFGIGIVTLLQAIGWQCLLPIDWTGLIASEYWASLGDSEDDKEKG